MCLKGNLHPHWEQGCDSPVMHIVYKVWIESLIDDYAKDGGLGEV